MKKYLYLLLFTIFSNTLSAQLPRLKYDDLHELNNRILLVDQESFGVLGEQIPSLMQDMWQLHEEVHFKSTTEIDSIRSEGSDAYAVLKKDGILLKAQVKVVSMYTDSTDIGVITYNRIESPPKKVKRSDYLFYLPLIGAKDVDNLATIKLSLKLMYRHLEYIEERKIPNSFIDFAAKDASKNSQQICDYKLLISKEQVWRNGEKKIRKNYSGELDIVSPETIRSAVINETENVLVSMGKLQRYQVIGRVKPDDIGGINTFHFRSFVHPKTAKIYSCSGYFLLSRNISTSFSPIEFKQHSKKCKK
ncbi:MAG: hypothetical protein AAGG68_28380 [Bacteroidota bacterium]